MSTATYMCSATMCSVTRKKSAGLKCWGHGMWQRSKCLTCRQQHSSYSTHVTARSVSSVAGGCSKAAGGLQEGCMAGVVD